MDRSTVFRLLEVGRRGMRKPWYLNKKGRNVLDYIPDEELTRTAYIADI